MDYGYGEEAAAAVGDVEEEDEGYEYGEDNNLGGRGRGQ